MRVSLALFLLLICAARADAQTAPSWAGAYGGAFGGFGSGQSAQHDNIPPPAVTPTPAPPPVVAPPLLAGPPPELPPADGRYGLSGGLGGGLIGYNFEVRRFVIGAEAGISGGALRGSSAGCGLAPHACGTSIDFQSDYRLRLGLPFGRLMPFVAGGLALDRIRAYDSQAGASGSALRAGYSVGAGLDYRLTPLWSLRLEYIHQAFGGTGLFAAAPGFPEEVWASTHIVRAGVTFTFGTGPVMTPGAM